MIEIYYPRLVPYMAPVVSPMVAHGRMLKKEYGEDVKVVFVGPCIAKKKESTDPRNFDSIDAVLNFNDIRKWMESERISIEDCGDVPFERLEPQVNQLYPVTGGIIHSVLSTKEQKDGYRKLHIHGTKNCIEFCDSLMAGEISGSFIEMNMCTGACINGSAPLDRTVSRFRVKIDMEEKVSREPADRVKLQKMSEGVGLGKQYSDHSTNDLMPTEEQESGRYWQRREKGRRRRSLTVEPAVIPPAGKKRWQSSRKRRRLTCVFPICMTERSLWQIL